MRQLTTVGAAIAAFFVTFAASVPQASSQPTPAPSAPPTASPAPTKSPPPATPAPPATPHPGPTVNGLPIPASAIIIPVGPIGPIASEGQMAFDQVAHDAPAPPGLLTVRPKQGQVFLELKPDQFDRPFLLVPILGSGLGGGLFAG